jgi:ribosomal protein S18 acetylase RimI-like enzyme
LPELEIVDWFVTQQYRHHGVGRKLYEVMVNLAAKKGCKSIALEAFCQNHQSIKTYERLGFVKDSLILKKKLE